MQSKEWIIKRDIAAEKIGYITNLPPQYWLATKYLKYKHSNGKDEYPCERLLDLLNKIAYNKPLAYVIAAVKNDVTKWRNEAVNSVPESNELIKKLTERMKYVKRNA